MTAATLYQPTPSMDRTPRGWCIGPPPAGATVLAVCATPEEARALREVASYIHDSHAPTVGLALEAYKAVDGPAHEARRAMERLARDGYEATVAPTKSAWLTAERQQRDAALAVLPRLG